MFSVNDNVDEFLLFYAFPFIIVVLLSFVTIFVRGWLIAGTLLLVKILSVDRGVKMLFHSEWAHWKTLALIK